MADKINTPFQHKLAPDHPAPSTNSDDFQMYMDIPGGSAPVSQGGSGNRITTPFENVFDVKKASPTVAGRTKP